MPRLSSETPQLGGSPSASTIRGNSSPDVRSVPLAEPRMQPASRIRFGPRPLSDSDSLFGDGGILVDGDVESGDSIAMEYDGTKRLTFELSLCGPLSSMEPPEAARQFAASKIALGRLLEDASLAHSQKLIIRWDDEYISRVDGTPLFEALVGWRDNTLSQRASVATSISRNSAPRGRSSWLWWGRGRSDPTTDEEAGVNRQRPGLPDPPSAPAGLSMVSIGNIINVATDES